MYNLGLFLSLFAASFTNNLPTNALYHRNTRLQHHVSTSAWNGELLAPSLDTPRFLPYFVPAGDRSIDDTSPSIEYSAHFRFQRNPAHVNATRHFAGVTGSTVRVCFFGNRVEWFGQSSPEHGIASVHLDGDLLAMVDAYSPEVLVQQRLFAAYDLSSTSHDLLVTVTGARNRLSTNSLIDVDAFVVQDVLDSIKARSEKPILSALEWSLVQLGSTGVAANANCYYKVEHNPLSISGHPAWASLYDLRTHSVRPLKLLNFGDVNGLQAVRMFNPCDDRQCDMMEQPGRIRLASPRWYNTVTRLDDGSVMIIGGSLKGGWMNNKTTNNPTIEFFPPKNIHGQNGLPIASQFLADTLNSNLFPIAFSLPDGRVFVAANRDAMIYDWRQNTEIRLPRIPNGVRVTYPMTGTGVLLPLSRSNGYTPEIMLCGGSTVDDSRAGYEISAQETASDQCSRLVLSKSGIEEGWKVETMPEPRIMPDAVTLPDGKILIVNGGRSGIAGYGNVKGKVGQSNAANPVFTPVLYDPSAPSGQRFSRQGMPTSSIARLYHSVATLTPNGTIMIAGSNPNLDRSNVEFGTEYRVEWLSPPYMSVHRPQYTGLPRAIEYGQTFSLQAQNIDKTTNIQVSLMDLGFVTHGVQMNARLVILESHISDDHQSIGVAAPPNAGIYPPGPAFLYLLVNGVPSPGQKVMVGKGSGPPVDQGAIDNTYSTTAIYTSSYP
ncbi:copper radical oxidase [Hydnum rufescens UP504]|uniref:Copper radical oxidase n=1 Tax=Hydnum rufescens UP504 TaxID=1448309 RepID=A0A9P6DSD6_9AGAM|nr:copper radical oxidase [Hydnum rufescens UP504]